MKKITTILSLGMLLFWGSNSNAQITVQTGQAASTLVQNVLIGNGVSAFNVTFSGDPNQIGSFNAAGSNIALPTGIVMSSGDVSTLVPGGNPSTDYFGPGDPMILATAQSVTTNPSAGSITSTNDAAVLEFDFIPLGDTVKFRFVFGSEEYTTWINTQYNDAFGFYLTGPNPAGGNYTNSNLALVPNTTLPITISTIHPGLNSQYYIGNPIGHSLNGITVPIEIVFPVVCGATYHFKFAIADCVDGILDTGVFLEGGSFSSDAVNVSVATVTGDTTVIENCTGAQFIFSRPQSQINDTLVVNYDITGNASMGVDYNGLINPVTFLPGQDSIVLNLFPVGDGIVEGSESVIITAYTITQCGDTIVTTGTLYIIDGPTLPINESNPTVFCANDSVLVTAVASTGFPPYTYTWSYAGQTNDTAYVPILQNGSIDYYVTATDQCGNTGTDTVTVTMNQTLAIDTMMMFPASACTPDGAVSGMGQGITGQPHYHWEGPNTGGPSQIDATVMQNLSPGWYVFTITDNVCSVTDSILLTSEPGPIANMSLSSVSGCNPLNVTFTNNSQNATNFEWYFDNGNNAFVNDLSSQSQTFTASADQIVLIAINGPCRDTAFASVLIVECGCTDPLATNYDPTAVQNDGSCIFPEPTVIVPNIFTPNGDANNDVFKLTTTNATDVIIKINNRWGNNVYVGSGLDPHWDGKIDGTIAPDGVYFLQYTVKGLMGKEITGQGFLQLIRQ
ncbi:choice-of-anchor L domain-containing protein [Fluviicola taffensis]|uniref:choice-of-anchor L domain-containing protein n=1 Tax=Fluviicola taffensis TaxID=191579 RepID=UPI003137B900